MAPIDGHTTHPIGKPKLNKDSVVYTPALGEEEVLNKVYNLLEARSTDSESNLVESLTNGPNIPALGEQLAVLV